MLKNKEITIRRADLTDIKKLGIFFIKAYGKSTVFQDENFLRYYFYCKNEEGKEISYSLVGINGKQEIISHYGGLYYELRLDNEIIPMIWGVNAYTLPNWRGRGINSEIVDFIKQNNESNAVIGMPIDAPSFYKKIGYNIFQKESLNRYIYALDSRTYDVVAYINQNVELAKQLIDIKQYKFHYAEDSAVVALNRENYKDYIFDLNIDAIVTTNRSSKFLDWRIFNNPYIQYKVYGYLKANKITTYIVIREEILNPMDLKVHRIIDVFGKEEGIKTLLNRTIIDAHKSNSIYLDFSSYGKLYQEELLSLGFQKLEGEEVSILPMVTAPIENRPNHEFIVLQSQLHNNVIQQLSSENVYFTRIDGDRDRIARINQIKNKS